MDCCKSTERSVEEKKELKHRLNRIMGQLGGISKMVDEDKYCDDILIQLSAVDKAVKSLANKIVERHMHTCVIRDIKDGKYEIIDEIVNLFRRFQ